MSGYQHKGTASQRVARSIAVERAIGPDVREGDYFKIGCPICKEPDALSVMGEKRRVRWSCATLGCVEGSGFRRNPVLKRPFAGISTA